MRSTQNPWVLRNPWNIHYLFSINMDLPIFLSRSLDNLSRTSSLRENGLVPSTTILILPKTKGTMSRTSGDTGGIMDYIWLLLTPLTAIWAMLSSFLSGNSGNTGNQAGTGHQSASNSSPNSYSSGPSTSS